MFGVDSTEFLILAAVALVVIGPKDLPKLMRTLGYWVGRARGMARHFTSGIETMMREAELEEMEKKWREDNERIMREHPLATPLDDWGLPGSAAAGEAAAPPAADEAIPADDDAPPADKPASQP